MLHGKFRNESLLKCNVLPVSMLYSLKNVQITFQVGLEFGNI